MTNPDRDELVKLEARIQYEIAARETLVRAPTMLFSIDDLRLILRRLASSDGGVKGELEPVAWRDIIKQPDERPLPTYGQIPWAQLGRDVNDATFGRRADFEFSDKVYPGHQMVLGINFNSLARIVDKYRYYGLPCAAKPYAAPPADAWMREALDYAEHLAVVLWSKHFKDSAPNWKPLTGDLIGLLTQIDNMTAALTAPGATTKSDGGECFWPQCSDRKRCNEYGSCVALAQRKAIAAGDFPSSPSDPSSIRSDVTVEGIASVMGCLRVMWSGSDWGIAEDSVSEAARALFDQFEIRRRP